MRTRQFSSLFFILVGMLPLLLTLLITLQKKQIRLDMEEQFESSGLTIVIIPEIEVQWMDEHEIWVNNKMFDISSFKLENGMYTFTGLYDERETLLVEFEKNRASADPDKNRVLGFLFKSLPCYLESTDSPSAFLAERSIFFQTAAAGPLRPFKEILTPPPQMPG